MFCTCLEYQRHHLQDGGNLILFRIGMYQCNHVVYPFKGLYLSVKTGRATFKGFRRLEALQRLNAYKEGVLKGYMGESQTLFEEL